ncbi:XRE family transcriptional regulator [Streptomyces netropsis]
MPRWKALPEELDPQVREFAEQLRRLVERSGLSVAAVADRTGYSKSSWERYLNGRLLPPRAAAEALAEATGTDVGHLSTMWELAERSWSRSELRHDATLDGMRVAQARAALGEFGPPAERAVPREPGGHHADPIGPQIGGRTGPQQGRPEQIRSAALPPARVGQSPDVRSAAIPDDRRPRAHVALFLTGVLGALLVVAAALLLFGMDEGETGGQAGPGTSPSGSVVGLPAGVKCSGGDCAGKDPETMGCGGRHATTAGSATIGTSYLEVRYSKVCGAAWARITQAVPGDTLRVSAAAGGGVPARSEDGRVDRDADGYTRMVPVAGPERASACATLTTGRKGCTVPRAASAAG